MQSKMHVYSGAKGGPWVAYFRSIPNGWAIDHYDHKSYWAATYVVGVRDLKAKLRELKKERGQRDLPTGTYWYMRPLDPVERALWVVDEYTSGKFIKTYKRAGVPKEQAAILLSALRQRAYQQKRLAMLEEALAHADD